MKNKLLLILPVAIIIIAAIVAAILLTSSNQFRLDEQYYGDATLEPISPDNLQQLIDNKASFAVFVSQSSCRTSADFEKNLQAFISQHPMKFYEIAFSELKTLPVAESVRFYPSFLIFQDGKLIDFLEADNNEDASAYTSIDGFEAWFTQHVALPE